MTESSGTMKESESLQAIQFRLYESLRSQIITLTGYDSEDLICYEHEFLESVDACLTQISGQDLKKSLLASDIILFSDFHSLPDNQKACYEMLAFLVRHQKNGVILALECFCAEDQHLLHAYLEGSLDEEELFSLCHFDESWGFPWEPIAHLIRFARDHSVYLRGINQKLGGRREQSVHKRDAVFASNCLSVMERLPDRTTLVLTGEYHLSSGHLPLQLQKLKPSLIPGKNLSVLFFSVDKIYFNLLESGACSPEGIWQGARGEYHFPDPPPWGKWYSYLLWQEHKIYAPPFLCSESGSDPDGHLWISEPEDWVKECLRYFRHFFRVPGGVPEFSELFHGISHLPCQNNFASQEKGKHQGLTHYLPESKTLIMAPLDWKGLIRGLGQSLISSIPGDFSPDRTLKRSDPLLRGKIWSQIFEFLYNPVAGGKKLGDILSEDFRSEPEISAFSRLRPGLRKVSGEGKLNQFLGNFLLSGPDVLSSLLSGMEKAGDCSDTTSNACFSGHKETR